MRLRSSCERNGFEKRKSQPEFVPAGTPAHRPPIHRRENVMGGETRRHGGARDDEKTRRTHGNVNWHSR